MTKHQDDLSVIANQSDSCLQQSLGVECCVDFDTTSADSVEDIVEDYKNSAAVVITETVDEKSNPPQSNQIVVDDDKKQLSPEIKQHTLFYGESPFFPKTVPENVQEVVVTSANIFMCTTSAVYVTGVYNFKENKSTDTPFILKNLPAAVSQITGNRKRVVLLIEGKVYTSSNLQEHIRLKRVGELIGVKQIACCESHYAALTTYGEVYLWGTNKFGEIGKSRVVSMDRPSRVKELEGKKVVKVLCCEGYTACLTEEGDVVTLGEIDWPNRDKVIDICGNEKELWGLRTDGIVVCNDGSAVSEKYHIDRIKHGLGSVVGESNGLMLVECGREWHYVAVIGSRDWSGYSSLVAVAESGKHMGFTILLNSFRHYISQMEVVERSYTDVLVPKIQNIKNQTSLVDEKKDKKRNKKGPSLSSLDKSQSEDQTNHLLKLEQPLELLSKLYKQSLEIYKYMLMMYSSISSFKVSDLYDMFFDKLEKLYISYSEAFPKFVEVLNISKMLSPQFLSELNIIEKINFNEKESTNLFHDHCDLLSIAIIPFKFLTSFYNCSFEYRKIKKISLDLCNESLRFEDIHSIEHVYSNASLEFIVYLSSMKDLVLQLTRPNIREPKYREIFLLMYRLYTTPECVMSYLIHRPSVDETYDKKKQILVVLKQWIQTYPNDFAMLSKSETKLVKFLQSSHEPYKKIIKEKQEVLQLFQQVKNGYTEQPYTISLNTAELNFTELMIDPNKIANTMTYVYKKLFIRIKPVELLYYLDKTKKHLTQNIKNMIDCFNCLSRMISGAFNSTPDDKKFALLENIVKILNVLLKKDRNYHAICGIVFSFIRIPGIEALKKKLSGELRKNYEYFDDLCLFESNYKNLRDKIDDSEQPLLPFMGTISRDLVLASEYNASMEGKLYNFNKLRIMYQVVMKIINYQPGEPSVPQDVDPTFHEKFCKIHGLYTSHEDEDFTVEYVVGYIMLAICALFILISILEVIGKTIYHFIRKDKKNDNDTSLSSSDID
ncbi:Guanine nucleotide exchange factor [Entamoeba marina]